MFWNPYRDFVSASFGDSVSCIFLDGDVTENIEKLYTIYAFFSAPGPNP
jgi:hypothetical protein